MTDPHSCPQCDAPHMPDCCLGFETLGDERVTAYLCRKGHSWTVKGGRLADEADTKHNSTSD